jgi:hypothetical protein
LGIDLKTVARKLDFLAAQVRMRRLEYLEHLKREGRFITDLQFDEMETFERSKCLPLSIPLVVESESRRILAFGVASMPASGPLAEISRRKYGFRKDERASVAVALLRELGPVIARGATLTSDQNPKYPGWLRRAGLRVEHHRVKGRRPRASGQGELKVGHSDPLFWLNHTAAMLRANMSRLIRRTWCTTKRADRLLAHLEVYADYHNRVRI